MSTMNENISASKWATDVAAELGNEWTARPWGHDAEWSASERDTRAYLTGPDGLGLFVIVGGYGNYGRVKIQWDIPGELTEHSRYDQNTRKEITVAQDKPAKRAAGDITRRLLPGLAELVAELTERKTKSDNRDAAELAYLNELADILHGHVRTDRDNRNPEVSFGCYANGGTVKQYYDDTVEMKIRIPRDQVTELALTLAKIRGI